MCFLHVNICSTTRQQNQLHHFQKGRLKKTVTLTPCWPTGRRDTIKTLKAKHFQTENISFFSLRSGFFYIFLPEVNLGDMITVNTDTNHKHIYIKQTISTHFFYKAVFHPFTRQALCIRNSTKNCPKQTSAQKSWSLTATRRFTHDSVQIHSGWERQQCLCRAEWSFMNLSLMSSYFSHTL